MDTRREFIKKAAMLSGAAGAWSALPESLQQALAIEPAPGSRYLDAEHVVILMQENRSFDHCFGTLAGRSRLQRSQGGHTSQSESSLVANQQAG